MAKPDSEKEDDVLEDLGPEQKKVGQLGPTEKVGPKGAVGKLVGASESKQTDENIINMVPQAVAEDKKEGQIELDALKKLLGK